MPIATLGLAQLRASQINGCSVCADMHSEVMRKAGETDERMFAVAAWRRCAVLQRRRAGGAGADRGADPDSPTGRTRCRTRSGRRRRGTTTSAALAALILAIASINVWNRLNVAVGQVVWDWRM